MTPNELHQSAETTLLTFILGLHLSPPPYRQWATNLAATYRLLKGLGVPMNPMTLIPAALTLGEDAVKIYQDLAGHDKAGAVAACLDTLPALATVFNKPVAELQAVVTAEDLGIAYDLEQDAVRVLPLIEAALAARAAKLAA